MPTTQAAPRPLPAPPLLRPPSDDPRLPALRDEVARRLRTVCADMPPDAFDALVLDVVRFRLRWEDR